MIESSLPIPVAHKFGQNLATVTNIGLARELFFKWSILQFQV